MVCHGGDFLGHVSYIVDRPIDYLVDRCAETAHFGQAVAYSENCGPGVHLELVCTWGCQSQSQDDGGRGDGFVDVDDDSPGVGISDLVDDGPGVGVLDLVDDSPEVGILGLVDDSPGVGLCEVYDEHEDEGHDGPVGVDSASEPWETWRCNGFEQWFRTMNIWELYTKQPGNSKSPQHRNIAAL